MKKTELKLSNIEIDTPATANNLTGIALQDLYEALQEKTDVGKVPIMEDAPKPEDWKGWRKLIIQRIEEITKAIQQT